MPASEQKQRPLCPMSYPVPWGGLQYLRFRVPGGDLKAAQTQAELKRVDQNKQTQLPCIVLGAGVAGGCCEMRQVPGEKAGPGQKRRIETCEEAGLGRFSREAGD